MIVKAIEFATRAHASQVRKSDGMPYIGHPMAVMALVNMHGGSEEAQIGALLHDVVEDTDVSFQEIGDIFGDSVMSLVREVTEEGAEGDVKASWEARKQASIDALSHKSLDALIITAADKLHNVMGLVEQYESQGDDLWSRFARGREKQLWVYRTMAQKIHDIAKENYWCSGLYLLSKELVHQVNKLSKGSSQ